MLALAPILMGRLAIIFLKQLATLSSCRFSKPLVKFHGRSLEKVDSSTRTTLKIESYKYPRISWLNGSHWTGSYIVNSLYNEDDKLTKQICSRSSNSSISDGNLKTKTKIIHYSDSRKIVKIDYMVDSIKDEDESQSKFV